MTADDRSTNRTAASFPLGASVTIDDLQDRPYGSLAQLRSAEPVSWLPALNGWLVTRRDLCVEAMRDDAAFTVDDPRFSTAAVLGPSMLSLEGSEHDRHRAPYASAFRPAILREEYEAFLDAEARRLIAKVHGDGVAEFRGALAGPLAVSAITKFLGLEAVEPAEVLVWYRELSDAIVGVAKGEGISDGARRAVSDVGHRIAGTIERGADTLIQRISQDGRLRPDEIGSSVLVLMFGAIETSEGMTANAIWHLLQNPFALDAVRGDRSLIGAAIEESLRLEPAAAVIDRYATTDVRLGDVTIPEGDLVSISLLGANRDPDVFARPDDFELSRPNIRQHVTFVQGPHACLGLHLARLETTAALTALLDECPDLALDAAASSAPAGLIFRKPDAVTATWAT